MNASQRRIFRRAVSSSLGLTLGDFVSNGKITGKLLSVSPTGGRNVAVKLKNGREARWPLSGVAAAPLLPA